MLHGDHLIVGADHSTCQVLPSASAFVIKGGGWIKTEETKTRGEDRLFSIRRVRYRRVRGGADLFSLAWWLRLPVLSFSLMIECVLSLMIKCALSLMNTCATSLMIECALSLMIHCAVFLMIGVLCLVAGLCSMSTLNSVLSLEELVTSWIW